LSPAGALGDPYDEPADDEAAPELP